MSETDELPQPDPLRTVTIIACVAVFVACAAVAAVVVNFARDQVVRGKVSPCVGSKAVEESKACQDYRAEIARSGDNSIACINYERATGREPAKCQNVDTGVSIDDPGQPTAAAQRRSSVEATTTATGSPAGPGGDSQQTPPVSQPHGPADGGDQGDDGDSTTGAGPTGGSTTTPTPGPVDQISHDVGQTVEDVGGLGQTVACQVPQVAEHNPLCP